MADAHRPKFLVPKVIEASALCSEWTGSLKFSAFTARELKEIRDFSKDKLAEDNGAAWMKIVDEHFIEGTINDAAVTAEDLQDLPIEVYALALKAMQGNLEVPKSQL